MSEPIATTAEETSNEAIPRPPTTARPPTTTRTANSARVLMPRTGTAVPKSARSYPLKIPFEGSEEVQRVSYEDNPTVFSKAFGFADILAESPPLELPPIERGSVSASPIPPVVPSIPLLKQQSSKRMKAPETERMASTMHNPRTLLGSATDRTHDRRVVRPDTVDALSCMTVRANASGDFFFDMLSQLDMPSGIPAAAGKKNATVAVDDGLTAEERARLFEITFLEVMAAVGGKNGGETDQSAASKLATLQRIQQEQERRREEAAKAKRKINDNKAGGTAPKERKAITFEQKVAARLEFYRNDNEHLGQLQTRIVNHKKYLKKLHGGLDVVSRNKKSLEIFSPQKYRERMLQRSHDLQQHMYEVAQTRKERYEQERQTKMAFLRKDEERQIRLAHQRFQSTQSAWIRVISVAARLHRMKKRLEAARYVWRTNLWLDPCLTKIRTFLRQIWVKVRMRQAGHALIVMKKSLWKFALRVRARRKKRSADVLKTFFLEAQNTHACVIAVKSFRRKVLLLQRFFHRRRKIRNARLKVLWKQWNVVEDELRRTSDRKSVKTKKKKEVQLAGKKKGADKKAKSDKIKKIDDREPSFGAEPTVALAGLCDRRLKWQSLVNSYSVRRREFLRAVVGFEHEMVDFLEEHRSEIERRKAEIMVETDAEPTQQEVIQDLFADILPVPPRYHVLIPRDTLVAMIKECCEHSALLDEILVDDDEDHPAELAQEEQAAEAARRREAIVHDDDDEEEGQEAIAHHDGEGAEAIAAHTNGDAAHEEGEEKGAAAAVAGGGEEGAGAAEGAIPHQADDDAH